MVIAAGALLTEQPTVEARKHVSRDVGSGPHITVTSRYDPWKTASAPVRRGPPGDQVRLPGGAWVDCEIDCYYTLRTQSIDYWDTQREQGGGRD